MLDVEPDLAAELDEEAARKARAGLVVRVGQLPWMTHEGGWGPPESPGHLGLLVIDGQLLREVHVLETASAEVLGQGDLLRPWATDSRDLPFTVDVTWTVLSSTSVAVLDAAFLRRAARWPEVLAALTRRAVVRAKSGTLHDAITNIKHVESRLLAQFWCFAERWGRVAPNGISLVLPLTHEMLASLVGATRPSVSTALGRLADRGLLARDRDGVWLLSPASADVLAEIRSRSRTTGRR